MINWLLLQRKRQTRGQALVEFALIITVVLMIIFLIIESARILQGWVTVQNAAREGARYAITGQNMDPCPVAGTDKYDERCDDLRVASIITVTHTGLAGLPLNESAASDAFGNPPTDNSYDIEVWGGIVTEDGPVLQPDFAGAPGQAVVVRAVYNVPIITPFFRPIIPAVPVFGQVMMNNENFGSLGNPSQGQAVPPVYKTPLATIGASPTPSPSPTNTNTPTPGASFTPSSTPTITPTVTPELCGLYFSQTPVDGHNFVYITGEIGTEVTIVNASTGATLGTDVLLDVPGKRCPGFADFSPPNQLNQTLQAGDTLIAQPNDSSQPATAFVIEGTATPTVSPTPVPSWTPTAVITTPVPSSTPGDPYVIVQPDCGVGPDVSFAVQGWNWPTDEPIALFWDSELEFQIPAGHSGSFNYNWTKQNVSGDADNPVTHIVEAVSSSASDTADFLVPCPYLPTSTPNPNPTDTPQPEDLIIVGPPRLLNDPPLVAYTPITVSLTISNAGDIDVSSQFFVDVYFDPVGTISPTIGVTQSVGYMAVSSLAGGASRVITITAPFGFENEPDPHMVYGMVDSILQVQELREWNNVSTPLPVTDVTPAATPTATPTPIGGENELSGIVYSRIGNWVPQARAQILLFDEDTGTQVATTQTDRGGFYEFQVPPGNYMVRACVQVDQVSYSGLRVGISPPDPYVDVFLLKGPCS